MYKKFKRKLLIDLDGVLNEYSGNYDENVIPAIKKGAKEFLEKCFEENYDIKIFTTRNRLLVNKAVLRRLLALLPQVNPRLRCLIRHSIGSLTFLIASLSRTSKWLIENTLDHFVTDVTNVKEPAYLYIDDRCIAFDGDFNHTLKQINNFKVDWK